MTVINKIKKNKDYRKVYSCGKSVADRYLVLFFWVNNLETSRFGFTASKKIGNAVVRNRVRRLFKEVCRLNINKFPVGFDYVLLARNAIVGRKYQQVEESLLKLLKNITSRRGQT
ncbi:ribonuclease P protein component [Pelotomaculum terephthalicicum JT]|uniref:ribonuclease P protein component n=1 Tax=Pelotomaculum TaxID=191373 RepID=UPI0009C6C602|nr:MULTISPECIES: ribonuclease P protein component [Pelotomaculum]MCG9966850.1 ribonuclease P protein component [Pelotomaculum terephthalicicum JT]OPX85713.1 MAG: Ribonuclease P protein component [Pelotomaculum sp. PtaB.Bin117]OPY61415.1 MAG: Ribonuclease P protein component [Pelotomaculum sp. PtaU1.Bin065]